MRAQVPIWLLLLAIGVAHADTAVLAPGWQPLSYPAPEPGTYDLPPLGNAADGNVRDALGRARRLHDIMNDKIVVLSFIYRSCPDINGCPLANYVLSGVQTRIQETASLRDHVRLISMSFDPLRDRPTDMRALADHLAHGADWQFLTTDSARELEPILRGYGQSIGTERNADGAPTGVLSHVLRVFLIDRGKRIRNIYSSSFLHADTILSDIQTLLQENAQAYDPSPPLPSPATGETQEGAGREWPRGRRIPLRSDRTPFGLPPVPVPADNPLTAEKVALGRKLFFDRRLSRNDTMSCAMCHVPGEGFASNTTATAVGIEGRTVRRNAPSIYNTAYAQGLFVDARASRLEEQAWGPLLAANEMGNASANVVLEKVASLADYRGWFEAAFDGRGPTKESLGMALASYERTVVSGDSPFDRWYFAGQRHAISPAAQRGFRLFTGSAGCARCHRIDRDHALFTDHRLHDTGVGYRQTMARPPGPRRLELAPGTVITFDPEAVEAPETSTDFGRYEITHDLADRWKYRTPMLRNVALTAPYMHDGSVATLREVVELYNAGGVPHALLDPAIHPLNLTETDKADLVVFLETLTGNDVNAVVTDALNSPIGDPH